MLSRLSIMAVLVFHNLTEHIYCAQHPLSPKKSYHLELVIFDHAALAVTASLLLSVLLSALTFLLSTWGFRSVRRLNIMRCWLQTLLEIHIRSAWQKIMLSATLIRIKMKASVINQHFPFWPLTPICVKYKHLLQPDFIQNTPFQTLLWNVNITIILNWQYGIGQSPAWPHLQQPIFKNQFGELY